MFNPRLAPYSRSFLLVHDVGADEIFTLFRFPAAGQITGGVATNTAAIGTVGTTMALFLAKYSSAATPVVQGTVGSWAAGVAWAADVPRTMTMTAFGSTALFSAGEWVRLGYDEEGTGNWTEMGLQFDYYIGSENQEPAAAGTGPA